MTARIRYQPGRHSLVVDGARMLFVADAVLDLVDLWAALAEGDDHALEAQLGTLQAPWVLLVGDRTCRLHGDITVAVAWAQRSQELGSADEVTEALQSSPTSLRIGPAPSPLATHPGAGLPVVSGVVLAESVTVALASPAADQHEPEPVPDLGLSANRTIIWSGQDQVDVPPDPEVPAAPEAQAPTRSGLIDGIPSDLWRSSVASEPAHVAVPVEQPDSPAIGRVDVPSKPIPPRPVRAIPDPPQPLLPTMAEVPAAGQPSDPDEELRMTLDRNKIAAPSITATETVLAALCPLGHLSPAFAPQCRICGRAIAPQQPQTIARPTLGRLVLPDNESVDLDRPVIFGRAPKLLDEHGERPHLINVSQYGEYLSRMHLEISLQGWHVLARDLHSTSGSSVTLPGRQPETLRPEEPMVLEGGSLVDLAGSYVFRFEVSG